MARLLLPSLGIALSGFQDGLLMGIATFAALMAVAWLLLQWRWLQAMDEPKRSSIVPRSPTPPTTAQDAQAPGPSTTEDLERLLDTRTGQILATHKALRGLRSIVRAGLAVGALTASLFGPAALALWGSATGPGQRPLLAITAVLLFGWNAGCLVTLHRLRRLAHETLT